MCNLGGRICVIWEEEYGRKNLGGRIWEEESGRKNMGGRIWEEEYVL